ncbi:MAG: GAF domain-containing protein, partial [Deltaproteobacteria bacterium]|nr:GAF domain-containing protein [Deltaproteobacteria bacterium]
MEDRKDFSKVIADISILYELSLAAGQSLDLQTSCNRFLKTLMARKNLGYSSVWIKGEYLVDLPEEILLEDRDENSAFLVYANPEFHIKEKSIPPHHLIFSMLEGKEAFSIASTEDRFSEIITEKGIDKGIFAIFSLGKLGFLKLFSMAKETLFREEELNQLKNVISKFTVSLEGCIAHQEVIREISEREQVEEALRRSEEASTQMAQENAVVAEIGRIIGSSLNIDEVYERFTKEVAKLISFDRIMINIVNPKNNTTSFAYIAGIDVPERRVKDITPLKGTATFECMLTRSSMLIQPENIDECLARFPALLPTFQAGLRSIIFVPMISKDQFIGALSLRSLKPKAYTDQDVRLAESIANQIAGAIANAQLFSEHQRAEEALQRSEESAKRIAQENAVMAEIGKIISSSLNIDEVYERFTKEVAELISFDRIVINIVDIQNETTATPYAAGIDVPGRQIGIFMPLAGTATEECFRTRSSMLIQPEDIDECLARFPALLPTFQAGLRSIIFVPMISKDQFIGALSLRSLKPKAYTDQDVRLAESIANQIAGAIANAQLFAERVRAEQKAKSLEEQLRQSQKMEAIGGLAGGIAHDFNNLLTVIKGYAELSCLGLDTSDPLRGNIEEILKASERAANLTRQLLAFSRRQILDFKVINLNTLLKDLDKMLHRILGEDIDLVYHLSEDIGKVKTDPGQIEQVILNLAVNARDAMPSGGKLTIETLNVEL